MRIPKFLVAAVLAVLLAACGGGADASAAKAGAAPASTEEVRALLERYGEGDDDEKSAVTAQFNELAQRAAPGLLEIARDPATDGFALENILVISSTYVRDPEIFEVLRTRARALPDPAERQVLTGLVEELSASEGLPYPR